MANWRDVEVVLAARGLTRDESADLLDTMGQDGKQVRPLNRFSDFRLRLRDGGPLVRTNSGEYYLMGIDAPNWSRPLTIDELDAIDIPAQEWSGWDTQHLWVGVDGISAAASALSKSKAGKPKAAQASRDNGAKGGRPSKYTYSGYQAHLGLTGDNTCEIPDDVAADQRAYDGKTFPARVLTGYRKGSMMRVRLIGDDYGLNTSGTGDVIVRPVSLIQTVRKG